MRQGKALRAWWGITALVATVWACETTRTPIGSQRDLTAPFISLTNTVGDTQDISGGLRFTVTATDNLGLKTVRLTYSGGFIAGPIDTTFITQVKSFVLAKTVTFPSNSGAGGNVRIIGKAIDGAGNSSEDTLFIFLSNVKALQVTLVSPSAGAVASTSKYVPIEVIAVQNGGVQRVGWLISPTNLTAKSADSIITAPSAPFPDSVDFIDSVQVTGATGSFTIVGFAVDSGGRLGTSNQVTVTILSAANDNTAPQVEHSVPIRAEVQDTVTVHATDPSGIRVIGFTVRDLAGTLLRTDSVILGGTSTDIVRRFPMNLQDSVFPQLRVVQGFAWDAAATSNRGVSGATFTVPSPTGPPRADTITVVAGITRALPIGGQIMDAAVDSARNEVYLTNHAMNRVEVFSLASTTFVANIPVGSAPWGIALWPRDTLGHYGDTVVVANSGGTNLSIVDVVSRREKRRHRLPNFLLEKVQTQLVNGFIHLRITDFDFSDRPQYLAMTCKHQASGACWADSIIAVYSSAPTIDQSGFPNQGTMRWENLTSATPESHFFFEHAGAAADPTANDTIQIIVDRAWISQTDTILCGATGFIAKVTSIPFADTTFVRNSGDFTHTFMGEGPAAAGFARVLNYAATPGLIVTTDSAVVGGSVFKCRSEIDRGISPAIRVSDFISNTATKVVGVAVNFNGHTNMVRTTDSIYALDVGLRLGGTVAGTGGNPGMDFHPNNDFDPFVGGTPFYGGADNPNNRLIFAARSDGGIDVFDTYNFARVTTIPIRDPVIGPLRVAKAGTYQILVGVTARGVVAVRLPTVVNIFPAQYRGVSIQR